MDNAQMDKNSKGSRPIGSPFRDMAAALFMRLLEDAENAQYYADVTLFMDSPLFSLFASISDLDEDDMRRRVQEKLCNVYPTSDQLWMITDDFQDLYDELLSRPDKRGFKREIYRRYKEWCAEQGEDAISANGMFSALLRMNMRPDLKKG